MPDTLDALVREIRACRLCAVDLPHAPRPVLQVSATARIGIFGQAPGTRVHASGIPFTDPSGDRLRNWLGIAEDVFYDAARVAVVPMGFCFPGLDAKGGDLPPRKECAPAWRQQLMDGLSSLRLIVLVGAYAQRWHLGPAAKKTLTATVQGWRAYGPLYVPIPHPSWRNNAWIRKNPWFETDLLPPLRARVARLVAS